MKRILLLTAAFGLWAGFAQAGITTQQLADLYASKGYTNIEITTGLTQMKVEGVLNGVKVEVIYDIETGKILQQENQTAEASDATDDATEIKSANEDFLDAEDQGGDNADVSGDDSADVSGDDSGQDNGNDSVSEDSASHDSGEDGQSDSDHESGDSGSED